jgi:hypothetical protein
VNLEPSGPVKGCNGIPLPLPYLNKDTKHITLQLYLWLCTAVILGLSLHGKYMELAGNVVLTECVDLRERKYQENGEN